METITSERCITPRVIISRAQHNFLLWVLYFVRYGTKTYHSGWLEHYFRLFMCGGISHESWRQVGRENLVGNENGALLCMMRNLEIERVTLAAMGLGIARCG